MNVKIGNVEMGTFEGAYRLQEDGKTKGYYPSFRDMLAAFADTELGKVNAESVQELREALDRIESAVAETSLRHLPKFVTPTGETGSLNDKPADVLSTVEKSFVALMGRRFGETHGDGKVIGRIVFIHAAAAKMTDMKKSDIYRRIALDYHKVDSVEEFKKLPRAREFAEEIKTILRPWFEDQEKS
jgi:hypothetical protein